MNVVLDSSAWLAYALNEPSAHLFAKWMEKAAPETHFAPSVVVYEVFRKVSADANERTAYRVTGDIKTHCTIIALTSELAIDAAKYAVQERLSMADAIVYATAKNLKATLVTGDAHFKGKQGVEYVKL